MFNINLSSFSLQAYCVMVAFTTKQIKRVLVASLVSDVTIVDLQHKGKPKVVNCTLTEECTPLLHDSYHLMYCKNENNKKNEGHKGNASASKENRHYMPIGRPRAYTNTFHVNYLIKKPNV